MSMMTGVTRGGQEWIPAFAVDLNQTRCIGCGRCFKVCPRDVLELVEREETGDADGDDGFSDSSNMVMSLKDLLDCIGCMACARVCPKKCLAHAPQALAA
ncbi:MAG: ferredoxin III, nif-specific [Chromatiaceae bacterium]|nr:ferredoxin III, nif-specific [Chromatiaceae bacterium]